MSQPSKPLVPQDERLSAHGPVRSDSAVLAVLQPATDTEKVAAIAYYMGASFVTQYCSKAVLSVYHFPFAIWICLMQMCFAALTCYIAARPRLNSKHAWAVLPLTFVNMMNTITGLMGTGSLNVPMFIVLRRFTMVFTVIIELFLYNKRHHWQVLASVSVMVLGAIVAAATDLTFNWHGYISVFANNAFTALYLAMLKHQTIAHTLDASTLLFYNSALSVVPLLLVSSYRGDWQAVLQYPQLYNPWFQGSLLLMVCMGVVINHSTYVCTQKNEPLTTSVAGSMKNVVMTMIGAVAFGDFMFHAWNAAGICMSMAGAIWYAVYTAVSKMTRSLLPVHTRVHT